MSGKIFPPSALHWAKSQSPLWWRVSLGGEHPTTEFIPWPQGFYREEEFCSLRQSGPECEKIALSRHSRQTHRRQTHRQGKMKKKNRIYGQNITTMLDETIILTNHRHPCKTQKISLFVCKTRVNNLKTFRGKILFGIAVNHQWHTNLTNNFGVQSPLNRQKVWNIQGFRWQNPIFVFVQEIVHLGGAIPNFAASNRHLKVPKILTTEGLQIKKLLVKIQPHVDPKYPQWHAFFCILQEWQKNVLQKRV